MPFGGSDVDRIVIPRIPLLAHLGVTEEERAAAQEIFVELVLHLDLAAAGASDDLGDSVDYDAVCRTVGEGVGGGRFHLIEAVAEHVAAAVLAGFDVARVDVRVEKPAALRARGIPFAAVEISRERRG